MTRQPSFYAVLGIGNSASAEQIRDAYLRLMKRHHPDIAGEAPGDPDFLPLVNQAYEALSDPVKRADYDSELRWQGRKAFNAARAQHAGPRPRGAPPHPALWAALALGLGAVAVAVVAGGAFPDSMSNDPPALSWLQPGARPSATAQPLRLPPASEIRRAAHRGATVLAHAAASESSSCFADARARDSVNDAQLCIVFDDAFLYSHKSPSEGLPLYFQDVIVDLRHMSALGVSSRAPVLARLWRESFAALMAELRQPPPTTAAVPEAPAGAGAEEKTGTPRALAGVRSSDLPQVGTDDDR